MTTWQCLVRESDYFASGTAEYKKARQLIVIYPDSPQGYEWDLIGDAIFRKEGARGSDGRDGEFFRRGKSGLQRANRQVIPGRCIPSRDGSDGECHRKQTANSEAALVRVKR